MKSKSKIFFFSILLLIFFSLAGSSLAYDPPIGIPDPGFGIDAVAPAQPGGWPSSQVAGYYYIDNTHPSATDTSNVYGYPNKPRVTLPTAPAAGSVIYLAGGPYSQITISNWAGTSGSPIWITSNASQIVLNNGNLSNTALSISGSSYVYIEKLKMDGSGCPQPAENSDSPVARAFSIQNSSHILLRHVEVTGYPNPGYNTTRFTGWPFYSLSSVDAGAGLMTEYVVLYDLNFHDNGVWPPTFETGRHCINSSGNARYVWVLDSTFVRNQEDGIQLMTAGGRETIQYWYIGRNSFSQLGENGIDLKLSSDTIVSQNTFFNIERTNWLGGQGSDGAAVVINDEGPPDRAWVMFNHFYDCGRGVRSQSPGQHYVIGNLIHDANIRNGGLGDAVWSASSEMNVVDNTIYNVYEGIVLTFGQTTSTVHGNIVSQLLDNTNYCINLNQSYFDGRATNNIYYDSDGTCLIKRVYAAGGNLLNTNPQLADPAGGNFELRSDSLAISANSESSVYDLYYSTYGIDIKKDRNGTVRPQNSAWDMGAIEYVGSVPADTTPPAAPSGLSVS